MDSEYSDELPYRGEFKEMAVIIEIGSFEMKVYDVKTQETTRIPPELLERNNRIYGHRAIEQAKLRGASLVSPFDKEGGAVRDWNLLLTFFKTLFKESLSERTVVIVETTPYQSSLTSRRHERKKLAQILIDTFHIEGYFVAPQPLFAMCHLERNSRFRQKTGVVIDVGHSQTRISVIYHGNIIHGCAVSSKLGGNYFNELLQKEIMMNNLAVDNSINKFREEIKHEHCTVLPRGFVTKNFLELLENKPVLLDKYKRNVQVGDLPVFEIARERFIVPEVLFNPDIILSGYDITDSLPSLFKQSKSAYEKFRRVQTQRNNPDYESEEARDLFKKVYICGSVCKMEGMVERIVSEVEDILIMEHIKKYELNKSEAYEEVRRELGINFYHRQDRNDRGNEALNGAQQFVEDSENSDWLYAVQIEKEINLVVEKCPK